MITYSFDYIFPNKQIGVKQEQWENKTDLSYFNILLLANQTFCQTLTVPRQEVQVTPFVPAFTMQMAM